MGYVQILRTLAREFGPTKASSVVRWLGRKAFLPEKNKGEETWVSELVKEDTKK
jgi:hypothetical protein